MRPVLKIPVFTDMALFRRARIMAQTAAGEEIGHHPPFSRQRRKSGKYTKVNFFALEARESLDGGIVLVNPAANCIPSPYDEAAWHFAC
ncbi:MAG: hypothetical protein EOP86_15815 [Verrucomicrobiaceae bacterium]|nr:MAG: hypothetical protein EOP86_15815 [Verrucomicrobiaceae bacterium]